MLRIALLIALFLLCSYWLPASWYAPLLQSLASLLVVIVVCALGFFTLIAAPWKRLKKAPKTQARFQTFIRNEN